MTDDGLPECGEGTNPGGLLVFGSYTNVALPNHRKNA